MFERMTGHARLAVVQAQEASRRLRHDSIGTGHVLVGMIRVDGTAGRVLLDAGVDAERALGRVGEVLGKGGAPPKGVIPFTPNAKDLLQRSLSVALARGDNYIGTGHILLAILDGSDSTGARVLMALGGDPVGLEAAVAAALGPDDIELVTPVADEVPGRRRWRWRRR